MISHTVSVINSDTVWFHFAPHDFTGASFRALHDSVMNASWLWDMLLYVLLHDDSKHSTATYWVFILSKIVKSHHVALDYNRQPTGPLIKQWPWQHDDPLTHLHNCISNELSRTFIFELGSEDTSYVLMGRWMQRKGHSSSSLKRHMHYVSALTQRLLYQALQASQWH